jgi:hypothetical protein
MSYLHNKPTIKNYKQQGVISKCLKPPKPVEQIKPMEIIEEEKSLPVVEFVEQPIMDIEIKESVPVHEEIHQPTKYLSALDLLKLRAK